MRRTLALALVLLPLVVACHRGVVDVPATPSVTAQLGQEFEIKVGQSARVTGTAVTITLRAVTEDSRCPIDVQCVWQGNARTVFEARTGEDGPSTEVVLNTGVPASEAQVSGLLVRLVGVLPAPRSTVRIRPEDYSAVLVVSR